MIGLFVAAAIAMNLGLLALLLAAVRRARAMTEMMEVERRSAQVTVMGAAHE